MQNINQRKICIWEGCKSLTKNKGRNVKGKSIYDTKWCCRHYRLRSNKSMTLNSIDNKTCEACGWEEAYCDRHRIVPALGYTKENVKILCPNCHRLATIGKLKFA